MRELISEVKHGDIVVRLYETQFGWGCTIKHPYIDYWCGSGSCKTRPEAISRAKELFLKTMEEKNG